MGQSRPIQEQDSRQPLKQPWLDEPYRRLVETVRDYAIFLLDTEGNVASWNLGAERMKGYSAEEVLGRHISVFYPQAAIDRRWPQHELETAARLGRFEDEGWRVRKDGSLFWADVLITAIRDEDGQLQGFSKVTRDLSERRENEERLRQSEERFRLLLEGIEDYALFMLDNEGVVTSWNTGAARITGFHAADVLGQSFQRFYTPEDVTAGRPAEELRETVMHRRSRQQGWRLRKDGTRYWADVSITAMHAADGRLRGFAHVARDLSERKRMEALEEQGRHLTEFLAMLAHELRNPLAPIRNALAIMAAVPALPPQVSWTREVIERQAGHLARLVDDLLDVSRITRGKLRLKTTPMDLNVAVQRALESSRPLVDERGHRLDVHLSGRPIMVHGDMTRLAQVVLNLLNNAAKYTPQGGRIDVRSGTEGDEHYVRVRDNGAGISPQMIERVFDIFAQGERTLDRAEGGLGIGLTLARRLVALHGGTITARSEGSGKGAEFEVRLPRLTGDFVEPAVAQASYEVRQPAQRRSILVVEDNADAATSMAMLLRLVGHVAEIEHDGHAALARAAAMKPDIVLLDIGLPGLDGYEVAKRLRAGPGGEALRIYAMTGYGQEEDRRRSLASGFDGHLVKPVMPSELFALIDVPAGA